MISLARSFGLFRFARLIGFVLSVCLKERRRCRIDGVLRRRRRRRRVRRLRVLRVGERRVMAALRSGARRLCVMIDKIIVGAERQSPRVRL